MDYVGSDDFYKYYRCRDDGLYREVDRATGQKKEVSPETVGSVLKPDKSS
jgi:hypothetical protein